MRKQLSGSAISACEHSICKYYSNRALRMLDKCSFIEDWRNNWRIADMRSLPTHNTTKTVSQGSYLKCKGNYKQDL